MPIFFNNGTAPTGLEKIMGLLDGVTASDLFVNGYHQQYQLESLSNQALSNGIDLYTKKDYYGAAKEFKRAISLNPASDYSIDATKYLAQSYLKLDQTDKAIEAYQNTLKKKFDAPDLQLELGNLLYAEDRFEEAVQAYRKAVNLDPSSSTANYSLGQGLMQLDKNGEAREAFSKVIRLEPHSPHGYLGLGQSFARQGDYKSAIEQFDKALGKQDSYYEAVAEKGYAYADMGDIEEARKLLDDLQGKDKDLSTLLEAHINKVEPPKMVLGWGASTFRYTKTLQTPLSALDSYFTAANTSKSMTMKLLFSKDMDQGSIETITNWTITREQGSGPAQTYNFGNPVPESEIRIDTYPNFVLYDAANRTATIGFTLTQNSSANGTIDPSHIVFKFSGKDSEGIKIDPDHDEFSGFSRVA